MPVMLHSGIRGEKAFSLCALCVRLQHIKSRDTSPSNIFWYATALTRNSWSRATRQPPIGMKSEFVTILRQTFEGVRKILKDT